MKYKVSCLRDSRLLFVISKYIIYIMFFFYPLSIGVLSSKCRALASRYRECNCYMKTVSNCFSIYPLCQTSREFHSWVWVWLKPILKKRQHTVFMEMHITSQPLPLVFVWEKHILFKRGISFLI